jgi:hypothetical protein
MGFRGRWEGSMFLSRKQKSVICVVCGQTIAPKERRFVEKNRVTKAERHTHIGCKPAASEAKSS